MNNGTIFNFKLYKDALKQLRISGVIFLIIICFPIFWGKIYGTQSAQNFPISILAMLSFLLIAPLMTANLFGFLNKRNASDFFHAIPASRTCIYITYITAIMTWIAGILLVSTVLGIGYFSFQKQNSLHRFTETDDYINFSLPIAYKNTILFILAMLVCSLLVIGVVLIAMSLSGTLFMGFAGSCIILFLPGILITYINYYIELIAPFLDSKHFFFLVSSDSHNLVSSSVISMFGYDNQVITDFCTGSKILYTFVLAVIALFIGGILFNRRNSACAGFFTIYPWVQTLSRCFCCLAVSLLPLSLVLTETLIQEKEYVQYFFLPLYSTKPTVMIVIWYLIAVFVYFLFELINTKKFKSLVKAIPGLVIVALLNVMVYGIIWGVTTQAAAFSPDTDDIEYVLIDFSSSDSGYNSDFVNKLASEIKITDKTILNLVSQSLNEVTHKAKNNQLSSLYANVHKALTFGIYVDETLTYRKVFLGVGEITKVYNYLNSETDLFDNYFKLPRIDINNVAISELGVTKITNAEIYDIYQYFLDEVDSLSFYAKKNIILNSFDLSTAVDLTDEQKDMHIFNMFVYFQYDGSAYSYEIPISPKTPKAYNQLLSILYNHTKPYLENSEQFAKDYPNGLYILDKRGYYECALNSTFKEYEQFFELTIEDLHAPTIYDNFYFFRHPYREDIIGVIKATDAIESFVKHCIDSIDSTYDLY